MSKKTIYFLGILLTILIGMWLQNHFCCSQNCSETTVSPTENNAQQENNNTSSSNTSTALQKFSGFGFITDNESFSCSDNFNFLASEDKIISPVSDSINLGIEKLKVYLEKPGTSFEIVGSYNTEENNTSIFPNLGLARANAVKNYLVSKGIDEKKLSIYGFENTDLAPDANSIMLNAIALQQKAATNKATSNETDTNWAALKNEINANPIRLYFQTGSSEINLTQNQKQQIHKIIQYVNAVDGAKILVQGHTDNVVGVNATNQVHSTRRANFVKQYLIANGIKENKIIAEGKADTQPIAENTTAEGRAKNRRVEILVQ